MTMSDAGNQRLLNELDSGRYDPERYQEAADARREALNEPSDTPEEQMHSPTPWRLNFNVPTQPVIMDADGVTIGALNRGAAEQAKRAVNNHDALLEALEEAEAWLEDGGEYRALEIISAAIKAAKA